jgi:hypothetical protein
MGATRAALLLPGRAPTRAWWETVHEAAARHHLQIDTWVADYSELMRLIWSPDSPEQLGVVATRADLPPEPLIVLDELRASQVDRPRWIQRRRL